MSSIKINRYFIFLLSCLFSLVGSQADEIKSMKDDICLLADASRIESSRIYESGEPSLLTSSFNKILKSKSAKEDFEKLYKNGKTNAARLYALTGLHHIDNNLYREYVQHMDLESKVERIWFCGTDVLKVSDMLNLIETGKMLETFQWVPKSEK
ncbi:MAG: hypothetical protein HC904_11320 [Blastochloris sp.]|nr:hypothetical protein [Blastochloris sp.]